MIYIFLKLYYIILSPYAAPQFNLYHKQASLAPVK